MIVEHARLTPNLALDEEEGYALRMNTGEVCILYTTVGSADQARAMAQQLVEQQCVACAHIFPAGQSIYCWEGKLVEENEVVVFLKTKEVLKAEAMDQLASIHPYECPCILSIDLNAANDPYVDWISTVLGV